MLNGTKIPYAGKEPRKIYGPSNGTPVSNEAEVDAEARKGTALAETAALAGDGIPDFLKVKNREPVTSEVAARAAAMVAEAAAKPAVETEAAETVRHAGDVMRAGRAKAAADAAGHRDESAAAVTHDALPTLPADPVQLAQVFQNLIGNALKYRSQSAPKVHVAVQDRGEAYEIAVRDNGIGIEPQYFERIFMVFQRLHNKGEYPGTGIGLAIVKKVVERHGGSVRVESTPGEGSAFSFTLPKHQKETGNGG